MSLFLKRAENEEILARSLFWDIIAIFSYLPLCPAMLGSQ